MTSFFGDGVPHVAPMECPAEAPRETHPRSPQSSPAESAEEHSERSWQRRRKALLGSPATCRAKRVRTRWCLFPICFFTCQESKHVQRFFKIVQSWKCSKCIQSKLGVGWLRDFFSISKYTGHGGKMFFFTNKAPFPWSADKISSSKAISSASASAGVPGLWLW